MTTTPLGTIQGLSSNIQWQDLITQIIAGETTQKLDPVTKQITTASTAQQAWASYQGLVDKLETSAQTLRDTSFDSMQSFVATDPSGRSLASVTATGKATPGNYSTEVVSLAAADKIGGAILTSATAALHLTGEFFVNGAKVTVADGDSLNSIRDKINAANAGTSATGVSASVLTIGSSSDRITLTSTQVGAGGIQLADGSTGVLAALGLVSSAGAATTTTSGGAQSFRFNDSSTAIGTLLGASSVPPATTIAVGNTTISVDLSVDSLDAIRAKLVAAGVTASISTPTFNTATKSQLDVSAPIGAVPGDVNSQRIVDLLGFTNTRGAVAQTLAASSPWTATGGGAVTNTTALSDIHVGGSAVGLVAGDSITLAGTRGDGVAVSTTITLDGTETVQTLLDKINASTAFGSVTRSATASIAADGTLQLTDSTAGASQLSLSMVVTKAAGGTATLGQMGTQVAGYNRELVHGSDAAVRIDGTLITRSSNTISDAIPGATISLLAAEPGTTTTLTIARDTAAMVTATQSFVTAYNAVSSFVKTQTASGGQLPFNTGLRASLRSLTDSFTKTIPGISSSFSRAGTVGLTLDKTGTLQLDANVFSAALTSNLDDVKKLFGVTGTPTDGITYLGDSAKTQGGSFAVNITTAGSQATLIGSGFTGTYTDSGTPDGVTITDGATLATGRVTLATGDTTDTIVGKFNSLFSTNRMQLSATNVGGQLVITSTSYGSAAKFNVDFDVGDTQPGTQLGLTTGQSAGVDVAGTINGVAATGAGQSLTGAVGDASEGLAIQYTGAIPYTGSIAHTVGLAGLISNVADAATRSGDGLIAGITTSLQTRIDTLTKQSEAVQARLDAHKTLLTQQFTRMEAALSKLQAQTSALTNQINGLQQKTA
jgi:flagellar hook-associated protein 2